MSSSQILKASALALACAVTASATTECVYALNDTYDSSNFFSKFNYNSAADLGTGGYVAYQNEESATSLGLTKISSNQVVVGVDSTSAVALGEEGRKSVRLESTALYNHGLFIIDIAHLPVDECGLWPAFWTANLNGYPAGGEIDFIENINIASNTVTTLHTRDSGFSIGGESKYMEGTQSATAYKTCDSITTENAGCSANNTDEYSYGSSFNSKHGGVFAMEWTSEAIKVWSWSAGGVPSDISSGFPVPTGWGIPQFSTLGGTGEIDSYFYDHRIIINTDFCGSWAGQQSIWELPQSDGLGSCQQRTGYATCDDYVGSNFTAFENAYWAFNSIKVYQNETVAAISSSAAPSSTSSTRRSTSSTAAIISSTSSIQSSTSSTATATSTPASVISSSSVAASNTATVAGTLVSGSPSSAATPSSLASTGASTSGSSSSATPSSTSSIQSGTSSTGTATSILAGVSSSSSTAASSTATAAGILTSGSSSSVAVSGIPTYTPSVSVATGSSSVTAGSGSTAASSAASSSSEPAYTTSTVQTTSTYTVTSCAADVTDCPARLGQVTTVVVDLYTTVCPVTAIETSAPASTTEIVYTTTLYTSAGQVTTEIISLYTTLYPVEEASTSSPATSVQTSAGVLTSLPVASTTSIVYGTSVYTSLGQLVTDTISLYTTIFPVEEAASSTNSAVTASSSCSSCSLSIEYQCSTSTKYRTLSYVTPSASPINSANYSSPSSFPTNTTSAIVELVTQTIIPLKVSNTTTTAAPTVYGSTKAISAILTLTATPTSTAASVVVTLSETPSVFTSGATGLKSGSVLALILAGAVALFL